MSPLSPAKNEQGGSLWIETPLIFSPHISARLGCDVYLKLENLQPSQSFKYRGISHFIQHALSKYGSDVHLIIASGGNAGLAAAGAARALGLRCTIYIPEGVSRTTIAFLKKDGAEVVISGKYYLQALSQAQEAVQGDKKSVMVPAYDEPLVWEGHASMIEEIARQLPPGTKPAGIFCSVGGGGLLGGVMLGCKSVGWDDVPCVALETHGSNCFYQSLALNPGAFDKPANVSDGVRSVLDPEHNVLIAHLPALTSRAVSLGASSPSAGVVKIALERKGGIKSVCISDEFAMNAGVEFAEEHKMLVELACSVTLAPAYSDALFAKILPETSEGSKRAVVFIVCGGFRIDLEEMADYKRILEDVRRQSHWEGTFNGESWSLEK